MPEADSVDRPNFFRTELQKSNRARPLILAHRGDSFHAPENTLEAARLAWESGADAWELDVQLTRDGVPVVVHDDSLLRTTNVRDRFPSDPRGAAGYLVADFDLGELRSLDAGSWFLASHGARTAGAFETLAGLSPSLRNRYRSGDVRIPTLAEALKLTIELDWYVNIEVKSFPYTNQCLLDAVLDLIHVTGAAFRVLISSFDHTDLVRTIQSHPEIATGVLTVTRLAHPHSYVKQNIGADFYHPSIEALGSRSHDYRTRPATNSLHKDDIEALRSDGIPILTYTVNETGREGLAVHLAEAGVSGIFTDDPARMRTLFGGR